MSQPIDPQPTTSQPEAPAPRRVMAMNGRPDAKRDVTPMAEEVLQAIGCTTVFEPGWETDAYEGVVGLCRPFQRDLYGCASDCWWPAQVPDELSNYGGWSDQCGNAEKDWANGTFIE